MMWPSLPTRAPWQKCWPWPVPIPAILDYIDYLRGGKDPSDGAALIACPAPFGQWERRDGGREYRGIRTRRYTYVRDAAGPWLLFDNQIDPFQMQNLANQPAHSGLQMELEALLARKLKASADEFLPAEAISHQFPEASGGMRNPLIVNGAPSRS